MYKKRLRLLNKKIAGIIVFFALTSMVALFMPLMPQLEGNGQDFVKIILGIIFWIGLAAGIGTFCSINKDRKIYNRRHKIVYTGWQRIPGAFKFYQNNEALIAEIAFLLSALILTVDLFFRFAGDWLKMLLLCVCVFAFLLHCVFNSKNYKYIKSLKAGEKNENEKK